ncbi:hypothetical protein SAMN06295905_1306 [Devosia lucknowensis]|uniref:Uncharacterized protein n=1 Tax=Devosia lucknowensis TaxID=1096929 RepID=A0A1Y6ETY0_9HYPH|nr:hypothetical protein [Devosia lucknowensis]SMQ65746.1 hypothetical protein SAMN06295905_1306 [Devosia lucknowensis]
MLTRLFAVLGTAAVLCACSTTYSDMGLAGGVSASPVTSDVYRISSRGNGFTDATTIQDYSLLKAAETTLSAGKTHFIILSGNDTTRVSTQRTAGTMYTNFYGNTAYSTYSPGYSYNIVKPGEDLMIRVFTPGPREQLPVSAFRAQEVFDSINPRVQRPKS